MYCSGVLFAVICCSFITIDSSLFSRHGATSSFLIYIPLHPFIISCEHASGRGPTQVMPQAPKAKILSSESRVYNSILSVLQGCCLLNLFLQVDPALVVYQSPASIMAVRTNVTDGDGRTGVLTIVLTEFTIYFYFGIRRLTNFFIQYRKTFTTLYS